MTVNEAAAQLGLSPITLRVQIRNGKLRAVKRGRDWWITPAEVARYEDTSLRVIRCWTPNPSPFWSQLRCDRPKGHTGRHLDSRYKRRWTAATPDD